MIQKPLTGAPLEFVCVAENDWFILNFAQYHLQEMSS